jgi:Glycosyltransferase 61
MDNARVKAGAPPEGLLREVSYEELCEPVDLADLAKARVCAIAHIAPATSCRPEAPLDLGGILGPEPEVPPKLRGNANHPEAWWNEPFQTPALYGAALRDVICFGGLPHGEHRSGHMLLVEDRHIVKDSYFERGALRSLPADLVEDKGEGAFRLKVDVTGFLLEGLSRWWLLERLPEQVRAELRVVLYNDTPLHSWQLELLEGLGVTSDRLLYLTEPMRFERMIVPSPAYTLHRAAASAQGDTWESIGRAFDRGEGPARVYLSRSRWHHNRLLIDEAAVERRFQAHGFTILHPQELTVAGQIAAVRHARLIAGSAGSGMYLSAFARRGARKLILSPRNFTFRDDQLISHLRGEQIAYILCAPEPGQEEKHPRMADYRVEPEVLEGAIERWVGGRTESGSRAQLRPATQKG